MIINDPASAALFIATVALMFLAGYLTAQARNAAQRQKEAAEDVLYVQRQDQYDNAVLAWYNSPASTEDERVEADKALKEEIFLWTEFVKAYDEADSVTNKGKTK